MVTCRQKGCKFPSDGACLEGLGERCPHLTQTKATENPIAAEAPPSVEISVENLYSGDKLSPAAAAPILRGKSPTVVIICGQKDSGKTTFLARIHELFHKGPLGEHSFAGSRTLMAFGFLSWKAMMESGRTTADTERTKPDENDLYLYLKLRRGPNDPIRHLLINDITGETFRDAAGHQATCESLIPLTRADHVVILIDGAVMGDPGQRQVQFNTTRTFLKMGTQCGAISNEAVVHLILSKCDKLTDDTSKSFAQRKQAQLKADFAEKVREIVLWEICCRPEGSETENEISAIVNRWLAVPKTAARSSSESPAREADRDFCNFGRF